MGTIEIHVLDSTGRLVERHSAAQGTLEIEHVGKFSLRITDSGTQVWVEHESKTVAPAKGYEAINWGSVYRGERGDIAKGVQGRVMIAADPKPETIGNLPLSSGPLSLPFRGSR